MQYLQVKPQKKENKMADLKHVGRMRTTGRKVLVAFRTLPGDSDSALVVQTELLSDAQHDAIMRLVESPAGQNAFEFSEVMARTNFPEGGVMLNSLHLTGRLSKVRTSDVEMTPNTQVSIGLDQLNQIIAEQRGMSVNDLALAGQTQVQEIATVKEVPPSANPDVVAESQVANIPATPMTDEQRAAKLRSQADAMYKEAKRLRDEAETILPTAKKKVKAEA
jgi:hypothetical protein